MFLVVMVWGSTHWPLLSEPFAMLEFFAGSGNVSKTTRYAHISTAQLDVNLGRAANKTLKAFDLTSAEGFAFLAALPLQHFFISV